MLMHSILPIFWFLSLISLELNNDSQLFLILSFAFYNIIINYKFYKINPTMQPTISGQKLHPNMVL